MWAMKALIVDDGDRTAELMVLCLINRWPDIRLVATGSGVEAVQLARAVAPDILLLDLELTDVYGLQVLKEIRGFSTVPIVVVTGNSAETSRLKSLELGANDYLVKPFTNVELLGCVSAALRPTQTSRGTVAKDVVGGRGLVVDISSQRVSCDGIAVDLTQTEWDILLTLLRDHGGIVPYTRVCQAGWGTKTMARPFVQESIRQLGSKLGDDPRKPSLIQSCGDEGYCCALFA